MTSLSVPIHLLLPTYGDEPRRALESRPHSPGVRWGQYEPGVVPQNASDYMSASATRKGAGRTAPAPSFQLAAEGHLGGSGGTTEMRCAAAALSSPVLCWCG